MFTKPCCCSTEPCTASYDVCGTGHLLCKHCDGCDCVTVNAPQELLVRDLEDTCGSVGGDTQFAGEEEIEESNVFESELGETGTKQSHGDAEDMDEATAKRYIQQAIQKIRSKLQEKESVIYKEESNNGYAVAFIKRRKVEAASSEPNSKEIPESESTSKLEYSVYECTPGRSGSGSKSRGRNFRNH